VRFSAIYIRFCDNTKNQPCGNLELKVATR
jgi:hypothetical protein